MRTLFFQHQTKQNYTGCGFPCFVFSMQMLTRNNALGHYEPDEVYVNFDEISLTPCSIGAFVFWRKCGFRQRAFEALKAVLLRFVIYLFFEFIHSIGLLQCWYLRI